MINKRIKELLEMFEWFLLTVESGTVNNDMNKRIIYCKRKIEDFIKIENSIEFKYPITEEQLWYQLDSLSIAGGQNEEDNVEEAINIIKKFINQILEEVINKVRLKKINLPEQKFVESNYNLAIEDMIQCIREMKYE